MNPIKPIKPKLNPTIRSPEVIIQHLVTEQKVRIRCKDRGSGRGLRVYVGFRVYRVLGLVGFREV